MRLKNFIPLSHPTFQHLDYSLNFTSQRKKVEKPCLENEKNRSGKVTLSGLLNVIRVIVFFCFPYFILLDSCHNVSINKTSQLCRNLFIYGVSSNGLCLLLSLGHLGFMVVYTKSQFYLGVLPYESCKILFM